MERMKPLLVMDIDGVLNPAGGLDCGYTKLDYDGPGLEEVKAFCFVHQDHGPWLQSLLSYVDLVWATSWGTIPGAIEWYAGKLGLPAVLPIIPVGKDNSPRFGMTMKWGPVLAYAGNRPLIWADDDFGGKEFHQAYTRTKDGIPTCVHQVYCHTGLIREDLSLITAWVIEQTGERLVDEIMAEEFGWLKRLR